MKTHKGKKIQSVKINDIKLDNSPHYFYLGKYIGFCNSDGLPHGLGELIAPPIDYKLNKEKNIIEGTIKKDHDKTPWSCNGEWEDGVFVRGNYNMPPFSRYQGAFIFSNEDWLITGEGVELHYRSEDNYNTNNVVGHIKGIFDTGRLIKGEILNATLINYSKYQSIKKIILTGKIRTEEDIKHGGPVRINSGEIFYEIDQAYADGSDEGQYKKYKGEIDFDSPHGKGTMIFEHGSKYVGEWYNGARNGQGTLTHTNGDKYIGQWNLGYLIK